MGARIWAGQSALAPARKHEGRYRDAGAGVNRRGCPAVTAVGRCVLLGLVVAMSAPPLPARAQTAAPAPTAAAPAEVPVPLAHDALVRMDFQNVEIPTLVKFISEITGRNFVLDEQVKGRVSIVSPSEITVAEAERVFESVLQVKGFTVVDTGPVTKIVPLKDARQSSLPSRAGEDAGSDIFVTRLVPLTHVDANAVADLLQPLVSRDGLVSAYGPTNSLIVVDSGANIERLMVILQDIDVPGQERTVAVVPLRHAFAADIAKILEEATAQDDAAGLRGRTTTVATGTQAASSKTPAGKLRIVPELRSNSLVVIGSPFEIREVRNLIDRLDIPMPRGTGRIQVMRLRYADAVELVQVLADLLGIAVNTPLRQALPGRSVTEGGGRFGSGRNDMGQSFGRSVLSNAAAGGMGGMGGRRPANAAAGLAGGMGGAGGLSAGGSGAVEFESEVRVTADPATNSLVISAAPQDFALVEEVVRELDVPRKQVLVEAILFEITMSKARELGVELQGGAQAGDAILLGRSNFKNLGTLTNAIATGDVSGLSSITGALGAAISKQTIKLADGTEIPAGIALVEALEADSDINVLSAPNILTTDNEEAEIVVGQNVPFVTSRSTNETNLANTFSQVDRRDVGITLRLTPQITEGDQVRLFLFEEVSALVETSETQLLQLGPTTTVRSATTTVVVNDGETIAIGGLISDRLTSAESGVPWLMDVPGLGFLFSFESKKKEKVNLIILLTPRIVNDARDLMIVSDEQRRHFREAMRAKRWGFSGTLGKLTPPPRLRDEPATVGGVLLPALDLGAR